MSSSSHSFPFQSAQPRQEPLPKDALFPPSTSSQSLNREPTAASVSSSTSSSHSTHSPDAHPEAPNPTQAPYPVSSPENSTPSPAFNQENRGVPSSTYLSRIAPERDLADSLDVLTARDLSIHLFNAFALKQRARSKNLSPRSTSRRHGPRSALKKDTSKDAEVANATTDDNGDASENSITCEQVGDPGWRPPKVWTAWPVRAEEVPREHKEWEEDGPFAALRDDGEESSSGTLAELLVGHVLKAAKERLRDKGLVDREQQDASATRDNAERHSSPSSDGLFDEDAPAGEDPPLLAAEVLADDDHAASILRPSIQHILSNLDKLLSNLHHARASYTTPKPRQNTRSFDGATSEPTESNADISAASSKRKRRRSRKASTKTHQKQDQDLEDSTSNDGDPSNNRHSRKRQRTGSPTRSKPRPRVHSTKKSASRPRSKSRPAPTSRSKSPPVAKLPGLGSHKPRLAPLDWSTVLGTASLSAFPPRVVEKAAKRCADLFDEGVKFRIFRFDSADRGEELDVLPAAWDNTEREQADDSRDDGNPRENNLKRDGSRAQVPASKNIGRDATHGGVHVDGFLQSIQGQKWWRKKPKPRGPKSTKKDTPRRAGSD